jgi:hypothetical protein
VARGGKDGTVGDFMSGRKIAHDEEADEFVFWRVIRKSL